MIFSVCFYVTLFGREIWPVKVEDVIRLEGNDARWLDGCATLGLRPNLCRGTQFPPSIFPIFGKKNFPEKLDSVSS